MYTFLLRRIYLLVLFLWYQILFFCTLDVYSFGFISVSLYLFVWFGLDVHMDYLLSICVSLCSISHIDVSYHYLSTDPVAFLFVLT